MRIILINTYKKVNKFIGLLRKCFGFFNFSLTPTILLGYVKGTARNEKPDIFPPICPSTDTFVRLGNQRIIEWGFHALSAGLSMA